jgi:PhnB protein
MSQANAIPEGYPTATPYLTVQDGAKALAFYQQAFGATEVMRLTNPDGKIGHAEIKIGDSLIMLSDEFPGMGNASPHSLGGTTIGIHLYVEDVDGLVRQAVAAGARLVEPVEDKFYGDRTGKLEDPFGHSWTVATHQEDLPLEELESRFQALFADA